ANAHSEKIFSARFDESSHVKIKRRETAFVITDSLTVDENFSSFKNAVKMPQNPLPGKTRRHIHYAPVKSHRIIRLVVSRNGKPQDFPICRHRNVGKIFIVELNLA